MASLTLEAPMSPFGFGGTRDVRGAPCTADWAGTGGGTANPDFVQRLAAKDRSADAPTSPRNILRDFYVKDLKLPAELEDIYVDAMVAMSTGPMNYPGDVVAVSSWPAIGPGDGGVNNAISGKHCNLSGFAHIDPKPPVLWIRGADDAIVSDNSMFDLGALGKMGAVPGWPGDEAYPAQPMIGQIRAVLDAYAAGGGVVKEEVLVYCGHSPHLEHPERFLELLLAQVG